MTLLKACKKAANGRSVYLRRQVQGVEDLTVRVFCEAFVEKVN